MFQTFQTFSRSFLKKEVKMEVTVVFKRDGQVVEEVKVPFVERPGNRAYDKWKLGNGGDKHIISVYRKRE
jgi:hypothetical protein